LHGVGRGQRPLAASPDKLGARHDHCGAPWDGVHDDAPAFNAAFAAASTNGLSLSCPGGNGRIASTMAPSRYENVVLRCQGMAASTLNCIVEAKPWFLFQNPVNSAPQAPQIFDLNIVASRLPHGPSIVIQYNGIAGASGTTTRPKVT
jgi:hypothetical protein